MLALCRRGSSCNDERQVEVADASSEVGGLPMICSNFENRARLDRLRINVDGPPDRWYAVIVIADELLIAKPRQRREIRNDQVGGALIRLGDQSYAARNSAHLSLCSVRLFVRLPARCCLLPMSTVSSWLKQLGKDRIYKLIVVVSIAAEVRHLLLASFPIKAAEMNDIESTFTIFPCFAS